MKNPLKQESLTGLGKALLQSAPSANPIPSWMNFLRDNFKIIKLKV